MSAMLADAFDCDGAERALVLCATRSSCSTPAPNSPEQANRLAGKSAHLEGGAEHAERLTDGTLAPNGDFWNTALTGLLPSPQAKMTFDLGRGGADRRGVHPGRQQRPLPPGGIGRRRDVHDAVGGPAGARQRVARAHHGHHLRARALPAPVGGRRRRRVQRLRAAGVQRGARELAGTAGRARQLGELAADPVDPGAGHRLRVLSAGRLPRLGAPRRRWPRSRRWRRARCSSPTCAGRRRSPTRTCRCCVRSWRWSACSR